jgi:hypothetical protein
MNVRCLSAITWFTARPTPEFTASAIAATPSWSTHWRAICAPMSG